LRALRRALSTTLRPELDTGALIAAVSVSVPRRRLTPISPQWLDLIIIPLVGIADEGRRLGMGGGYFADDWDVRLNSLATESGVEHFL
jgi:5-formyltetrahydrofolate cyclo-ligase